MLQFIGCSCDTVNINQTARISHTVSFLRFVFFLNIVVRIKIFVSAAFDMRIKIKPKGQRYIYEILDVLTLKAPNKNCSRRHFNSLLLSFEKRKLDFSCEPSAKQRIHLKHQILFSLKNNEKVFMNVVCCSRD